MEFEGERYRVCWRMLHGLLGKTGGQSKDIVGNKAKVVGLSYIVLCLGSEELEINLVVNETHQMPLCRDVIGLELHIEINPERVCNIY